VRGIPGITDVATTTNVPLVGGSWTLGVRAGAVEDSARFTWVSPGYFRTLGIRQIEGRDFDGTDTSTSRSVAVVNQMFVREFLGGGPAIGRTFRSVAEPGYAATDYVIVGVVGDTKYNEIRGPSYPMAFAPAWQWPGLTRGYTTLMIRSTLAPKAAIESV